MSEDQADKRRAAPAQVSKKTFAPIQSDLTAAASVAAGYRASYYGPFWPRPIIVRQVSTGTYPDAAQDIERRPRLTTAAACLRWRQRSQTKVAQAWSELRR